MLEVVGVKHGDKVYAVSASGKKILAELFDRLLSEGNRLFYYDEFYDATQHHAGKHVFSRTTLDDTFGNQSVPEVLRTIARQTDTTLESENLRCY